MFLCSKKVSSFLREGRCCLILAKQFLPNQRALRTKKSFSLRGRVCSLHPPPHVHGSGNGLLRCIFLKKHIINSLNKTLCSIIQEKWGNMTRGSNRIRITSHIKYLHLLRDITFSHRLWRWPANSTVLTLQR